MEDILKELKALHKKLDTIMAAVEKLWPGLLKGEKIK